MLHIELKAKNHKSLHNHLILIVFKNQQRSKIHYPYLSGCFLYWIKNPYWPLIYSCIGSLERQWILCFHTLWMHVHFINVTMKSTIQSPIARSKFPVTCDKGCFSNFVSHSLYGISVAQVKSKKNIYPR